MNEKKLQYIERVLEKGQSTALNQIAKDLLEEVRIYKKRLKEEYKNMDEILYRKRKLEMESQELRDQIKQHKLKRLKPGPKRESIGFSLNEALAGETIKRFYGSEEGNIIMETEKGETYVLFIPVEKGDLE